MWTVRQQYHHDVSASIIATARPAPARIEPIRVDAAASMSVRIQRERSRASLRAAYALAT
jgi:hypothetical protein